MMILQNFRMAIIAIMRSKLRAFLTILGVVIGISSVVTVVAIGDGLKAQVNKEINTLGVDLITVTPQLDGKKLTEKDVASISKLSSVSAVAPVMYVPGTPTANGKKYEAILMASKPALEQIFPDKIAEGEYFKAKDKNKVVIGANIASKLYGDKSPISQKLNIDYKIYDPLTEKDKTYIEKFTVSGVYSKVAEDSSFGVGSQLDDTLFLPLSTGKKINNNRLEISEIDIKAKDSNNLKATSEQITNAIKNNHKGKEDFVVTSAEDVANSFNDTLNSVTNFITAVAAISLLVGGIGIMNIMLSSVTERTREIGIRKAIGATRGVIMTQFLIESLTLTMIGGVLGIFASFALADFAARKVEVEPLFTIKAYVVAIGISALIGIVFGVAPALQAARKKPIEALRHD